MNNQELLKKIVSHSKEYGFVYPSSEIYDGLSAVYDYGPYGSLLKNNIKEFWWKSMVQLNDNIVGLDSAIFMHSNTWQASGHIDAFNDPLIDNRDSKKRYRADLLVEEYIEKIHSKISKEIKKAEKRYGDKFDKEEFLKTNLRVIENSKKISEISKKLNHCLINKDLVELKNLILELGINDPVSGTQNWTDVKQFNLMFSTKIGSNVDTSSLIYLRPETAQGIFLNFLNVVNSTRVKIPFGIAQIGKAFRNEIIARQFVFRMREFEQMEMQFFVEPGKEMNFFDDWKNKRMKWHKSLDLGDHLYRFHNHENLAHYANAACDIEFLFPMGFKELEGIHSRTDFDLKSHQKLSGKKINYYDQKTKSSFVPYVIETSVGLDRLFLSVLSASYQNQKLKNGTERIFLKIPFEIAPIKAAILPLNAKDNLPEKAKLLYDELKTFFNIQYDEKDSIGKRYRRQDAIGTPYCITFDYDTLKDNSVTIRNRNSMVQERVLLSSTKDYIINNVSIDNLLTQV
ncbi:MAG TPA: glycine--tRNA ligase [Cytophagales bacterium]|jgi:glycyl-tRNA synthetase|nr:glycine--tRNA ligase [Cytophagales bacterium]